MAGRRVVLEVLRDATRTADVNLSPAGLARASGLSPGHIHRTFRRVTHETPKQYGLRVRLARAAALLATGDDTVLDVALSCGFRSHEVFTRAFRRAFGCTPTAHRARAAAALATPAVRAAHRAMVDASAPCVHLFHLPTAFARSRPMPMLTIERRILAAQPMLFVRRETSRAELATAIGESLGLAFGHAHASGAAIAGRPFVRYARIGPGLMTIEAGVAVAQPVAGAGAVEAGELAGGPAAVALHAGTYETLHETYTAMERWMGEQGRHSAGAPWELYLTDPAATPDASAWRTEIYWPMDQ